MVHLINDAEVFYIQGVFQKCLHIYDGIFRITVSVNQALFAGTLESKQMHMIPSSMLWTEPVNYYMRESQQRPITTVALVVLRFDCPFFTLYYQHVLIKTLINLITRRVYNHAPCGRMRFYNPGNHVIRICLGTSSGFLTQNWGALV